MHKMVVKSSIRDYEVHFEADVEFLHWIGELPHVHYVVDDEVWRLHGNGCLSDVDRSRVAVLPVSEERKCLQTVQQLYDQLIDRDAKRSMTLVSVGGGIVQDITGFVASTLYRGINWVFVPTTLLAQADSCVGSKTSLNYGAYKNLIGTFYPPSRVFVHTPFLLSQRDAHFFSGLGEVVKLHIMAGPDKTRQIAKKLPRLVRRDVSALGTSIRYSLLIKRSYITGDEFDMGRRHLLNYGHCFGHALESASEFGIPHGQAVVLGMLLANLVARRRRVLSDEVHQRVSRDLLLPILIVRPRRRDLDVEAVLEGMMRDKKRTGQGLVLIMMTDDHEFVEINDLTASEVSDALDELGDLIRT